MVLALDLIVSNILLARLCILASYTAAANTVDAIPAVNERSTMSDFLTICCFLVYIGCILWDK